MRRKSKPLHSFAPLLLFAGCAATVLAATPVPEVTGRLENPAIREASGLARSQREAGVLWVINDGGANKIVHAIDHAGIRQGEFKLRKSSNKDWEDLASFRLDDIAYLLIADIGDNLAKRPSLTPYTVDHLRAPANQQS